MFIDMTVLRFPRDMSLVIAAAEAAAQGDLERAAELIQESQKAIDEVVCLPSLSEAPHVSESPLQGTSLGLYLHPIMW